MQIYILFTIKLIKLNIFFVERINIHIFVTSKLINMDLTKLTNVQVSNVLMNDYPDFCDAYISYAEINGKELTEEQYNKLNENTEFVHEKAHESII